MCSWDEPERARWKLLRQHAVHMLQHICTNHMCTRSGSPHTAVLHITPCGSQLVCWEYFQLMHPPLTNRFSLLAHVTTCHWGIYNRCQQQQQTNKHKQMLYMYLGSLGTSRIIWLGKMRKEERGEGEGEGEASWLWQLCGEWGSHKSHSQTTAWERG